MVIAQLLAGCTPHPDITDTVRGIQVVAVEAIPAEPAPNERLTLKAWVADGIGRGVEVLVWVCTPVDGMCLEAMPPQSTGLPLSLWTRVGTADVVFESSNPWPFFAGLVANRGVQLPSAFIGGNLLVWTLACPPGVCPIIDQVRINPTSGSEAWYAAATALADPSRWIDELPRSQVSLAVKAVAVHLEDDDDTTLGGGGAAPRPTTGVDGTGPNHAPFLSLVVEQGRATEFEVVDPEADPLLIRSFATAGGVVQDWGGDRSVTVVWEEPLLVNREPVRFVVAEDGQGGTGVWCSAAEADPCAGGPLILGSEAYPMEAGEPLMMERLYSNQFVFRVPFEMRARAPVHDLVATLTVNGEVIASAIHTIGFEQIAGVCETQVHETWLTVSPAGPRRRCPVLGQFGTLDLEVSGEENFSASVQVVVAGDDDLDCQDI